MTLASPKYKYSDMEDSLQSRNGHEKDFKKRFLSTFQRVRGYPKPSAASKQLAVVQVALVSRKSTTGGEETLLEKLEWKLPQGAVDTAANDRAFRQNLMSAYFWKHEPLILATNSQHRCLICGVEASGSYWRDFWKPEESKMKITLLHACGEGDCTCKLQEVFCVGLNKAIKSGQMGVDDPLYCCNVCKRAEPHDGPKFFKCGNCRSEVYCSRECQVGTRHLGSKR